MDKSPLVSVLITSYNREQFIEESIKSVLKSTYSNFELIVVDDASNDQTYHIAKLFENFDKRIKVYRNISNLGDYPNRNLAASYATGKYLKYIDSDDVIFPNSLEIFVMSMENNPEAVLGISTRHQKKVKLFSPYLAYNCHFYEYGLLDYGPTSCIIRKDIFEKEKGFNSIRNVSDMDFWLSIAAKYPVIELPCNLVFWREHIAQESKIAPELYIKYNFQILKKHLLSPICPLEHHKVVDLLNRFKKKHARSIIKHFLKEKRFSFSIEVWNENNHSFFDLI